MMNTKIQKLTFGQIVEVTFEQILTLLIDHTRLLHIVFKKGFTQQHDDMYSHLFFLARMFSLHWKLSHT